MILELKRDLLTGKATFGKLFVDGKYFGETLEDVDRFLEFTEEGAKIDKLADAMMAHLARPDK